MINKTSKKFLTLILILFFSFLLISCDSEKGEYRVTLSRNINGGTVSGNGTYKCDKSVTIKATPSTGYEFDGWYEKNKLVSEKNNYTFKMPAKDLLYLAKFKAKTDTPYKVEHYLENVDNTKYTLYET